MKAYCLRGVLLVLCVLLLCACGRTPAMKYEDGVYRVSGRSYTPAPVCYEAKNYLSDNEVACLEQKMGDLLFYEIKNVPAEQMISSADYDLFCTVGTKLPELWEMAPERATVCLTEVLTYEVAALSGYELTPILQAARSSARFTEKDALLGKTVASYEIKFDSESFPAFYYCLMYRQYSQDVLVYQEIGTGDDFEILYPDVPVTVEESTYEKDGTTHVQRLAVYNFGKYILYNRATAECFAIDDTIAKKTEGKA